jgi:hypothetical protein
MSDQLTEATTATSSATPNVAAAPRDDYRSRYAVARSWRFPSVIVVIMVVLAMVGVALTSAKNDMASRYWMALVPIYGVLCVATAWDRGRRDPGFRTPGVLSQVFHWLGIAAALWLGFFVRRSGEETLTAASDNSLLLLALGCFLAGVHLEWLFAVVGLLLMMALVIVIAAEQYVWLIFVVSAVVVAAMVVVARLVAKSHKVKSGSEGS